MGIKNWLQGVVSGKQEQLPKQENEFEELYESLRKL